MQIAFTNEAITQSNKKVNRNIMGSGITSRDGEKGFYSDEEQKSLSTGCLELYFLRLISYSE